MLKKLSLTGDFAVTTALLVGVYKAIGIEWTWPLIAGLGVSGFCLSFGCVAIEVWRKNSRGS